MNLAELCGTRCLWLNKLIYGGTYLTLHTFEDIALQQCFLDEECEGMTSAKGKMHLRSFLPRTKRDLRYLTSAAQFKFLRFKNN